MTRKGRRIAIISTSVGLLAIAAGLVLFALRDSVVFFYTPSEVSAKSVSPGTRLRLGGLVKKGSIQRSAGNAVKFVVTDTTKEIAVSYVGLLPDLFREGQGVVAEGILQQGDAFKADSVLAKHDENYMPRDLADSLKKQGYFKHTENAKGPPANTGGK
ncbi:MAG: cytochrome c maturation protein CcmE [Hyphomicrobiales bacterium]|nr:cytochrome c maturation protein CcmE [Hyphomicrobiales bacterium]